MLRGESENEDLAGEPPARLKAADVPAAFIHLYRAEVQKAQEWRHRLDITTNWSVVVTAAGLTFALGSEEVERHVSILLISVLITFFLLLEARRFRHYDIWLRRVHLLESNLFAGALDPDYELPRPEWRRELAADLRQLHYNISFAEALGRRLRRNYLWLYLGLLLTWLVKVANHPEPADSFGDFIVRAGFGPISGFTMLLIGILFNGTLFAIALFTWYRQPGEVRRRASG